MQVIIRDSNSGHAGTGKTKKQFLQLLNEKNNEINEKNNEINEREIKQQETETELYKVIEQKDMLNEELTRIKSHIFIEFI